MKPALAIFRKDVRHLWPRIAVVLAVELLIGWLSFSQPAGLGSVRYPLGLVELLAWWYLIASAIHEEAVPGDRQYWLTRPFSKRDLLAAKLIFLLAFTCLPLFLGQVASLLLRGASPFAYLPDILVSQLFFLGTTVLPGAALASISAGLVEFVGTALAAWLWSYGLAWLVGGIGWRFRADYNWGALYWFESTLDAALMLVAGAGIVLLQYLRQRTWISRGIVAATLALSAFLTFMPGWHTAFQVQERMGGEGVPSTAASISFDPARDPRTWILRPNRWALFRPEAIAIPIAVRITGIPPGMALYSDRADVTIATPKGERWKSGWDSMNALVRLADWINHHSYDSSDPEERVLAGDGEYWMYLMVDRSFYERVRSGPMHVHAHLALTLLSPSQTTPLTVHDGPQAVPDDGFCLVQWRNRLLEADCLWPGRLPACLHVHLKSGHEIHEPGQAYLTITNQEVDRINSYAPFPTWGGLWQLNSDWHSAEARPLGADLVTRKAVAHFERDLDIPDLRGWTNR
jgi:hypothetical protein